MVSTVASHQRLSGFKPADLGVFQCTYKRLPNVFIAGIIIQMNICYIFLCNEMHLFYWKGVERQKEKGCESLCLHSLIPRLN